MNLHLIDSDVEVASALRAAFAGWDEVDVRQGDLLKYAEECVVSPANGYGFMDGGIDRDFRSFFGPEVEERVLAACSARPEGFLPIGASTLVRTHHMRIPFLIIAPTMTLPEFVEPSNAYRAMRAVLRLAGANRATFSHVYCPGLTTGVGGVAPADAAEHMARAYADFLGST